MRPVHSPIEGDFLQLQFRFPALEADKRKISDAVWQPVYEQAISGFEPWLLRYLGPIE